LIGILSPFLLLSLINLGSDNPFDWDILLTLEKYNEETIKKTKCKTHNLNFYYHYLHKEYLPYSFLKKYLSIAYLLYLVILLQTIYAIIEQYKSNFINPENYSYLFAFKLFFWCSCVFLHFISFHIGIFLALKYYDILGSTIFFLPRSIQNSTLFRRIIAPLPHKYQVKFPMFDIGITGYAINVISFTLLYRFQESDTILFLLWNFFYYFDQSKIGSLSRLTGPGFDTMLEGFGMGFIMITFIQLNILLPVVTLILLVLSTFLVIKLSKLRTNTYDLTFSMGNLFFLICICFFFVIFKLFHSSLSLVATFFSFPVYFINSFLITFIQRVIISFHDFLNDLSLILTYYLGKEYNYHRIRKRFYQFFLLYYLYKFFSLLLFQSYEFQYGPFFIVTYFLLKYSL
jgi:hypothetical protein